ALPAAANTGPAWPAARRRRKPWPIPGWILPGPRCVRAAPLPAPSPSPARSAASATGAAAHPARAGPARVAPCLRSARFLATVSAPPAVLPAVPAWLLPSAPAPALRGALLPVAAVLPAPVPAASVLLQGQPAFPPAACACFPGARYPAETGRFAPAPGARDVSPDYSGYWWRYADAPIAARSAAAPA